MESRKLISVNNETLCFDSVIGFFILRNHYEIINIAPTQADEWVRKHVQGKELIELSAFIHRFF